MNTKHTPEPWSIYTTKASWKGRLKYLRYAIRGTKTLVIAEKDYVKSKYIVCVLTHEDGLLPVDYSNASRIVACVNACAGMDDPAKEIASLRARIAELEQAKPITNEGTKTVVEYLMELPEGYRERALEQYDPGLDPTAEPTCMQDAIRLFAAWYKTIEGHDFWQDVCNHYENGSPLPPLPI